MRVFGLAEMVAEGGAVLGAGAVALAVVAARRLDRRVAVRIAGLTPDPTHDRSVAEVLAAIGRVGWIRRVARAQVSRLRLEQASSTLPVDVVVGAKAVAAAVLLVLGLVGPAPLPMLVPLLMAAAILAPDMVLVRRARRRRALMEAQIPQFLDLLAAGSTAGLAALLALRRATDSMREPLRGELGALLGRVDLGARWRPELRDMAERLELADLRRAVMAMSRTESLGTPLAESLRRRADEVRDARRARAAERARKAPVKMLFPLVFMILPAFLLLTVVPVLLSTLQSVR